MGGGGGGGGGGVVGVQLHYTTACLCNMDTVELSIAERMLFLCVSSDNILVLDIFFEALNYETIEQKKAYELAGLLGKGAQVRPRRLVNNSSAIVMDLLFSYFKEIL